MNADGTGQTRLANATSNGDSPSWSPDGGKVAYGAIEFGFGNSFEIVVSNADGTGETKLTNNAAHDADAAWSPDGNQIAFSSNRDGPLEIYVMNADGTGQTRITSVPGANTQPDWGQAAPLPPPGPPATVNLSPTTATNTVGTQHT